MISGLTIAGNTIADASGRAIIACEPEPTPDQSFLIAYMQVTGPRSAMTVRPTMGLGGPGVGQPVQGSFVSFSSLYFPGGSGLVLEVSGLQPGDPVGAQGTGIAGPFDEMLEYGVAAPQSSQSLVSAAAPALPPPNFSYSLRIDTTTIVAPFITNLTAGGLPVAQQLYLYYLMIVPTPASIGAGRIFDMNGNNLLFCPKSITVPLCLPLYGILNTAPPAPIGPLGGPQVWEYLFAENSDAADIFHYYAVGALV